VYSLLRAVTVAPFEAYLEQVLQPIFDWVTMLYGIDICAYYFTVEKVLSIQSTAVFCMEINSWLVSH
jgi:hypothetical protein